MTTGLTKKNYQMKKYNHLHADEPNYGCKYYFSRYFGTLTMAYEYSFTETQGLIGSILTFNKLISNTVNCITRENIV